MGRKRKRIKPPKPGNDYRTVWRIVDGAVRDALETHPDYLTQKGLQWSAARNSIVKRVVGSVLGFAKERSEVKGRSGA